MFVIRSGRAFFIASTLVTVACLQLQQAVTSEDPVSPRISPDDTVTRGNSTFGVLVRVFGSELPYISSFFRHYRRIGITNFHVLCTDHLNRCGEINAYLQQHGEVDQAGAIRVINFGDIRWDCLTRKGLKEEGKRMWDRGQYRQVHYKQFRCPNISRQVYSDIHDDYLLPVDPDEFLMLPNGHRNLQELVAAYPLTAVFRFRWIMVPYDGDGDGPLPPYRGYAGVSKKYMVRRSAISHLGTHMPDLNCEGEKNCTVAEFGPMMLHFHYRGLADAVLKDSSAFFKSNGAVSMLSGFQSGEPGLRMKLLAFSSTIADKFAPAVAADYPRLLEIDKEQEELLLRNHNVTLDHAQELYLRFKNALGEPVNWNRFAYLVGEAPMTYEPALNQTTLKELKNYSLHAAEEMTQQLARDKSHKILSVSHEGFSLIADGP